jgi:hypothetical protein
MTQTTSATVNSLNNSRLVYNKLMAKLIDIISPIYQDLLKKCERRKVSVNLDIEDLTLRIDNTEDIEKFYNTEIRRALKLCEAGDKITLSQSGNRFSVKNSAKTPLDADTVAKLREDGFEVRARFGYDTIISLKI